MLFYIHFNLTFQPNCVSNLFLLIENIIKGKIKKYQKSNINIYFKYFSLDHIYILLNLIKTVRFQIYSSFTGAGALHHSHQMLFQLCSFSC